MDFLYLFISLITYFFHKFDNLLPVNSIRYLLLLSLFYRQATLSFSFDRVFNKFIDIFQFIQVALSTQEKRKNTETSAPTKKPRFSISDCSSATPWRRATHSKELDICRVCGYYIEFKNRVELTCCGAKAHRNCVRNQTSGLDSGQYTCRDLSTYMKRGGRQNDLTVKFTAPITLTVDERRARREAAYKEQLICAVCHEQIESDDPVLLRNHLVSKCASIPFDPLVVDNNKYKLSRRLAALSSIYKINDGVRVRQRLLQVLVPSSDGVIVSTDDVLSEGSGGRHNPLPIAQSSNN